MLVGRLVDLNSAGGSFADYQLLSTGAPLQESTSMAGGSVLNQMLLMSNLGMELSLAGDRLAITSGFIYDEPPVLHVFSRACGECAFAAEVALPRSSQDVPRKPPCNVNYGYNSTAKHQSLYTCA